VTDAPWVLGRATGVVSLLLLTVVVALGVATWGGVCLSPRLPGAGGGEAASG
jgi:hypothetical protein